MRTIFIVTCLFLTITGLSQTHGNNIPSKKSENLTNILNLLNFKSKQFKKILKPSFQKKQEPITFKDFGKHYQKKEITTDGFSAITVTNQKSNTNHIILFHGGAYILEATKRHIKIIEQFVKDYNFKVTLLNYPKAPLYQSETCIKITFDLYKTILKTYPNDDFFFLGDSAGGGLALSILQMQRDSKMKKQPLKTALVSPWLDISLSNGEINSYTNSEVILDLEGLRKCGLLYAGNMRLDNPLISPIYADLHNLNSIMLLVSNEEIFYPDCVHFFESNKNLTTTKLEMLVYDSLPHDWILLPIPEQKQTISKIAAYFLQ